jgi:LAGLIDADG endonuclease
MCIWGQREVGTFNIHGSDSIRFCVLSQKDLSVVISHFDKYPLHSQKRADYELFKQAFSLVKAKEHLTEQGLRKIIPRLTPLF